LENIVSDPKLGLLLWCLTPLLTIFQLYRNGQFYWWRKPPTCHEQDPNLLYLLVPQKLFNYFAFQSLVYERT